MADARAAPKRRRSRAAVGRDCWVSYACVKEKFICPETGRTTNYRCHICDARLPRERDCWRHHTSTHLQALSAQGAAAGRAAELTGPVDAVWDGRSSSLGRAPGAPESPSSRSPAPAVPRARGSPPQPGWPDSPPFSAAAHSGLSGHAIGPADSSSDELVVGPDDSGSDPGSGGDDQLHPLAAFGIEDLPRETDSASDVESFHWDLGSDGASTQEPFEWEGSSSDGIVDDVGGDDAFCNGLCWEEPLPPGHAPVKRTGAWYHYHRQCPILPGHQTSVMQACFSMCMLKDQHRVPDVVVDKMCGYIHHVLLAPGNMFPPSFHLLKAVAGVPAASSTASDICDTCWQVYPAATSGAFAHPVDRTCRRCGAARFKDSVHGQSVPRRKMYNFGVQETLVDLLTRPGMVHAILDSRREAWTRPESFWGSPAGRALNLACRDVFSCPDTPGEVPDELAIAVTLGASRRTCPAAFMSRTELPCLSVHHCGKQSMWTPPSPGSHCYVLTHY